MADSQQRTSVPRGRGSGRGGRGGYSSRGGRPRPMNGDSSGSGAFASYDDEGEIGQLKKKYASNLTKIKEMFPDWTDDDIVFALEENGNDAERTVERMSEGMFYKHTLVVYQLGIAYNFEGNVSQWGEVKKKTKDRTQAKTQELGTDRADISFRGGRSRPSDGHRGGRGRAVERGRGGARGRVRDAVAPRKPAATDPGNETAAAPAGDTWETSAETAATVDGWDQAAQAATTSEDNSWEVLTPPEPVPPPTVEQPQASSRPDGTRTWASMLKPVAKPKPAVPTPKVAAAPPPPTQETTAAPPPPDEQQATEEESEPTPVVSQAVLVDETPTESSPGLPPSEPALELTPSKDQLTERNLEQVEDVSEPPATVTAASTAGTNDPRSAAGGATPAQATQQQSMLRPGLGGFQTTALKAATGARTPSFVRRVKEQQEAVVMPGNHAVDRTAVQFGSLGLGESTEDLDVDDDREEPETRTQPPQHSPVAPKASLPPISQQTSGLLKAAPGLAAPSQPGSNAPIEQIPSQQANQTTYSFNQFGNLYGTSAPQSAESGFPSHKPYDQFGQPASHLSTQPPNGFPPQSQAPGQPSQTAQQSHLGGFSTSASDYPSYYTSDNSRNTYQSLQSAYGQQPQAPQEGAGMQQKPSSAFATGSADLPSQLANAQAAHPNQTRFGPTEAQNSGHSTPNPIAGQQGQGPSHQQPHQMGQAHSQGHQHYPYGANAYYNNYYHPNYMSQHAYGPERGPYDDIRRYEADQYMSQNHYGYGANQGRYGGGPYAGANKYAQPHQNYGISPQSWDAHSSSPANVGGYGQQAHAMSGRENASSLGSYGRTGSTQPSEGQQQHAAGSFGGMPDPFGSRSQSGYAGQNNQQSVSQQGGNDDAARGYGEASKIAGGPSPAPGQTAGRPTSATNVQGQASQGQSQQSYAAYPQLGNQMHGQQSHYGSGLGGLGHQHPGQQSHQSGYGGYGAFGGNYYGSNNSRGW
ncbi:MAG: hypothetical protein LQ340_001909 [Diploschistes diacapsis]|nr:MAG: hypothetical protein LQ340_001909 [Diploschistes diacapsis]